MKIREVAEIESRGGSVWYPGKRRKVTGENDRTVNDTGSSRRRSSSFREKSFCS